MSGYKRIAGIYDTGCTEDGTGLVMTLIFEDGSEEKLNFSITMGTRLLAEFLTLFQHASSSMSAEDLQAVAADGRKILKPVMTTTAAVSAHPDGSRPTFSFVVGAAELSLEVSPSVLSYVLEQGQTLLRRGLQPARRH